MAMSVNTYWPLKESIETMLDDAFTDMLDLYFLDTLNTHLHNRVPMKSYVLQSNRFQGARCWAKATHHNDGGLIEEIRIFVRDAAEHWQIEGIYRIDVSREPFGAAYSHQWQEVQVRLLYFPHFRLIAGDARAAIRWMTFWKMNQ